MRAQTNRDLAGAARAGGQGRRPLWANEMWLSKILPGLIVVADLNHCVHKTGTAEKSGPTEAWTNGTSKHHSGLSGLHLFSMKLNGPLSVTALRVQPEGTTRSIL